MNGQVHILSHGWRQSMRKLIKSLKQIHQRFPQSRTNPQLYRRANSRKEEKGVREGRQKERWKHAGGKRKEIKGRRKAKRKKYFLRVTKRKGKKVRNGQQKREANAHKGRQKKETEENRKGGKNEEAPKRKKAKAKWKQEYGDKKWDIKKWGRKWVRPFHTPPQLVYFFLWKRNNRKGNKYKNYQKTRRKMLHLKGARKKNLSVSVSGSTSFSDSPSIDLSIYCRTS